MVAVRVKTKTKDSGSKNQTVDAEIACVFLFTQCAARRVLSQQTQTRRVAGHDQQKRYTEKRRDWARLGLVAIRYRQPPTEDGEGMTAKGQKIGNMDVGGLIAWALLGVDVGPLSLYFKPEH